MLKYWIPGIALLTGLSVWYKMRQPRFLAGDKSPDFQVTLSNGSPLQLSDLRGKYVLLHFWGSWCGPCRVENPKIVELYKTFGKNNFEVLSIGIEQQQRAWQNAIEKDSLIWPYHVMESQDFGGTMAHLFNIHSIPTTFLLNREGVIMGVNLRVEQIEHMLKAQMQL